MKYVMDTNVHEPMEQNEEERGRKKAITLRLFDE